MTAAVVWKLHCSTGKGARPLQSWGWPDMARPRGEVRQALAAAVGRLHGECGPVNFRQAAAAAQVGFDVAQVTLENMVRSGELISAGKEKPAGATHWMTLYELAGGDDTPQPWGGIEALADVVKAWSPA